MFGEQQELPPDHTPESDNHAGSVIQFEQARRILSFPTFGIDHPFNPDLLQYEQLIGAEALIHRWPSPEAKAQAMEGFYYFMDVFSQDAAHKLGITLPEEQADFHTFGDTEGALEILLGDNYREKYGKDHDFDNPLLPMVHYEGNLRRLRQRPGRNRWAGFRAFCGFRTQGERPTDPAFDKNLRLYLNPKLETTAEVTAETCMQFITQEGYMPSGKFMEDATSNETNLRDDRLLFYLRSPRELTTILKIINDIQQKDPTLFEGRNSVLVGDPVTVGGRVLQTARLGQEPPSDKDSLSSFMVGVYRAGIAQAFGKTSIENPSDNDVTQFMDKLKEIGPSFGRNPRSIAFNAGQDMDVIDRAIAQAA